MDRLDTVVLHAGVLCPWSAGPGQAGPAGAGPCRHRPARLGLVPDAEIHLLNAGHFALEDQLDTIAGYIRGFLGRVLN